MAGYDAAQEPLTALSRIAGFADGVSIRDLPGAVVDKTKLCVLDSLSASLTIGARPEGGQAIALVTSIAGSGPSVVVGTPLSLPPSLAAYVNGTSAACTARSDTHEPSSSHPGSAIVPAVLAVAQASAKSGATVVEAIVAGYEAWCRVGRALVTPELAVLFRPTGLVGPIGAAVGAARAMGLDRRALADAAGLAAHTVAGLNEWSLAGTTEHVFHSGAAARNGVESAILAAAGVHCAPKVLEGRSGLLAAYGALSRESSLTDGLGNGFEILGITHKPAPACIYAQVPTQLSQRLVREHALVADRVERIDVRVSPAAAAYPGCDDPGPIRLPQAAKMSIQFAVASVIVRQRIADENWQELGHPAVDDLSSRCRVVVDPEVSRAGATAVRIDVALRDGGTLSVSQDRLDPMTRADIEQRFMQAGEAKLGRQRALRAMELVWSLETLADLSELATCLHPSGAGAAGH